MIFFLLSICLFRFLAQCFESCVSFSLYVSWFAHSKRCVWMYCSSYRCDAAATTVSSFRVHTLRLGNGLTTFNHEFRPFVSIIVSTFNVCIEWECVCANVCVNGGACFQRRQEETSKCVLYRNGMSKNDFSCFFISKQIKNHHTETITYRCIQQIDRYRNSSKQWKKKAIVIVISFILYFFSYFAFLSSIKVRHRREIIDSIDSYGKDITKINCM